MQIAFKQLELALYLLHLKHTSGDSGYLCDGYLASHETDVDWWPGSWFPEQIKALCGFAPERPATGLATALEKIYSSDVSMHVQASLKFVAEQLAVCTTVLLLLSVFTVR